MLLRRIDGTTAAQSAASPSLGSQGQVALYETESATKAQHENGTVHVTPTQLVWLASTTTYALLVPLELIGNVVAEPGYWRRSPKLIVVLSATPLATPALGQLRAMFPSANISVLAEALTTHQGDLTATVNDLLQRHNLGTSTNSRWAFKLSFRGGGLPQLHDRLREALEAKMWTKPAAPLTTVTTTTLTTTTMTATSISRAGISAIKYNMERSQQETTNALETSFRDLQALMGKASDLVKIADKLTRKLEKDGDDAERSELRSILLSMGIANPVTKETAGQSYFEDLARQLAQFLTALFDQRGGVGMMTLPDVYCFFNRARGMALVSPEDLVKACELFASLRLPIIHRALPSGVQLVQLASFQDDMLAARVADIVTSKAPLSPVDLARIDGVSVVLARELLMITETKGLVCRDDAPEGLAFFPNNFLSLSC